jgi:predicted exporter
LAALASEQAGVQWVDKTSEVSHLLGHYRLHMTALLMFGYLAVWALLWCRFKRQAWRICLPTLLASTITLAVLGWCGQSLQLFNVLALTLLLGIGVDYGIFLAEHPGDQSAWVAVVLGAASTWLSFGLLGLSSTPALRAFGLTLLLGIFFVWMLAPFFRMDNRVVRSENHTLSLV